MILWIASYPKSGNTWLRALLSSYYFSNNGNFKQILLSNIGQFPEKKYFNNFNYNPKIITDTSRYWIKAQEIINKNGKINFFKTHNILGAINNINFTNNKNTLGAIYIIRDPRNVITSLQNHYELSSDEALKFMLNEKKYIFDPHVVNDYSDFQFISSWERNYKSWKYQKEFPVKIVKYENLIDDINLCFFEIIKFINKITNNKEPIDLKKMNNSINSTSFKKLKEIEKNKGFLESVKSKKKNSQIPFFNMGPKNDWKKILSEDLKLKINNIFKKNLEELSYKSERF